LAEAIDEQINSLKKDIAENEAEKLQLADSFPGCQDAE